MFERTEGRVTFAGVGGFAGAAHVKDHARKGQIFGDVDGAFQFIHSFDAAHALDFANGQGLAAFAGGAEVAAGGGVNGSERQTQIREHLTDLAGFLLGGGVKVRARRRSVDSGKSGRGNLAEELASQLAV